MTHMTMLERVMTKKRHQIFGQEESASPEKILATPVITSITRDMLSAGVYSCSVNTNSECMLLQISKEDLSTSDIERLLVSRQLQVDVVRRLGNVVCQAQRINLQRASNPALVRCS